MMSKKRKVLIVFDNMIADMEANKTLSLIVTELFVRGKELHISLVFMSQCYLRKSKTIKLNTAHFVMKTPNKRKLQQIASNHLSDSEYKDFMRL